MAGAPGKANLHSIDALERFRSALIVFRSRTQNRLDEVSDTVHRTQIWLSHDQRIYWQNEIRKRREKLNQAEQELMSARLSSLRQNLSGQTSAVHKAKIQLQEAETKLRAVAEWDRNLEPRTSSQLHRVSALRSMLETELPKAIAYLTRMQNLLAEYSESAIPTNSPVETPPQTEDPQP